jgi:hypothetical protein
MITSSQFGLRNSIFDRCFWAVADGFLEALLGGGAVALQEQPFDILEATSTGRWGDDADAIFERAA